MPSYDYECRICGHRVEVLHGVNDAGPTACERCGGPMRKLLSTPNIVFKGSGWAKKDARDARPAAKPAASAEKSESTESAPGKSTDSSGADGGAKGDSVTKAKESARTSTSAKESSPGSSSAD